MGDFLSEISGRYATVKKQILVLCDNDRCYSLGDFAQELGISVPKASKVVGELIQEGYLTEVGKQESVGGRPPSLYGLNPAAGYFVGIDVNPDAVTVATADFKGHILDCTTGIPFSLESTEASVRALCDRVRAHLAGLPVDLDRVRAYGVNLTGRVNRNTGYSYSYFISEARPIRDVLEEAFGCRVFVENDSRAMAFGEYASGEAGDARNILFLNVGWGLGMGMIMDGQLFYGKSGFSGEIGHSPSLDNDIICRCGKIGCLETGASGIALHRLFTEKLREGRPSILSERFKAGEDITLDDILSAIQDEDIVAIESIEEVGGTLGRALAGMINIFNPDLVIIGGRLAVTERYLMPPLESAINKHSLNLVNSDTVVKVSRLKERAGAIGASLLSKSRLLSLS